MFYFDDFYGKKILKSTLLSDYDCFFTTKDFILTPSVMSELIETSEENRKFLKKKLDCKEIITANQVHGDNIEIITKEKTFYNDTDALISNIENTLLLMNFADCVPIILYSKEANTGAIIHSGWRGCAKEITRKTVQKMKKELNILPETIIAIIGPSIGKCCFETDEDVFNQLVDDKSQTDLYDVKNHLQKDCHKKYFVDLKLLTYNQLLKEGVKYIDMCPYCTFCMSDIFCSYRKEKGKTARHSAILKIKGEK